jgi:hypothetical protein
MNICFIHPSIDKHLLWENFPVETQPLIIPDEQTNKQPPKVQNNKIPQLHQSPTQFVDYL